MSLIISGTSEDAGLQSIQNNLLVTSSKQHQRKSKQVPSVVEQYSLIAENEKQKTNMADWSQF